MRPELTVQQWTKTQKQSAQQAADPIFGCFGQMLCGVLSNSDILSNGDTDLAGPLAALPLLGIRCESAGHKLFHTAVSAAHELDDVNGRIA